jgi:hypothetical protein
MDDTTMKKTHSLFLSLLLSLGLTTAASTHATVITFDDLPATEVDTIPDGYQGFSWGSSFFDNVAYIHKDVEPNSGYENGVVSGDYAAFNFLSSTSLIKTSGGETFDFNGASFTSAWKDNTNLMVTGFFNNVALFTQTVIINTSAAQWFDFNFAGINALELKAWNYSPNDGNDFYVMDNFTINEPTAVPESPALVLLLLGLAGIFVGRRAKQV